MLQVTQHLFRSPQPDFEDLPRMKAQGLRAVLPLWLKFRREYDRLGYAGQNNVTRQLERVMDRLTLFFNDVAGGG